MGVTPIISETEFKSRLEAVVSSVPPGAIRDHSFFDMPANQPLIAVSLFQGDEGERQYGDIAFVTSDGVVSVT